MIDNSGTYTEGEVTECLSDSSQNKIISNIKKSCGSHNRLKKENMGDLDISLIQEFSKRPGFYDRSNPHFKDKAYIQQAWMEISHQLGYDAHLLKDRMYQLRNRYNLEKRRLENMRLEDPSSSLRSPWPLFYHLSFLDGHIRPRRSYKRMMKRPLDGESVRDNEETMARAIAMASRAQMIHRQMQNGGNYPNMSIKYESDESDDDQENTDNGSQYLDPSSFLADDSEEVSETATQSNYADTTPNSNHMTPQSNGINVKSIDQLKRDLNTDDSNLQPPRKFPRKVSRFEKYEAFGRFLSISLCDLDEKKALALVEKFTSDVVQALLDKGSE